MRARVPSLIVLLPLLPLTLVASPAAAAWPIHVSQLGSLISGVDLSEQVEASVSDGRGGAIVLLRSSRLAGPGFYAQRVRSDGTMAWAAGGVFVGPLGGAATATADGLGGMIVGWGDNAAGPALTDIRVQRVDSSGVRLWGANGVLACDQAADQGAVVVESDGAGGAVFVWEDRRNEATNGIDLYAQRVLAAGTMAWTANGVLVCNEPGTQNQHSIVRDTGGGFVIAFEDHRDFGTTGIDVYAQRLNASGARMWRSDGIAVSDAAQPQYGLHLFAASDGGTTLIWSDEQYSPRSISAQHLNSSGSLQWGEGVPVLAASDSYYLTAACRSGDAIILAAYRAEPFDIDVFAQRLLPSGEIAWGLEGVSVLATSASESAIAMHPDGLGGAMVMLTKVGVFDIDLFARRVNVNGQPEWATDGLAVVVGKEGGAIASVPAASGSVIVAASIQSVLGGNDAFAWRIDARGVLGDPAPTITRVSDVLADQGGSVAVEWSASSHDCEPERQIEQYSLWRDVPAALVAERTRVAKRPLRAERLAAQTLYWEYVATMPARARPGYSAVVATTTDSMPGSNPATMFMVSAERFGGADYWDSGPASGYSVDNLAPATPAPFTGQYTASATSLAWGANLEPDLAGYRLYRGTAPGFVVGPASLLVALGGTAHVDATTQPWFYKLTAVDVHGNESPASLLQPQGVLDAGDALSLRAHFAAPSPNPVRAGTSMTLRFGIASAGAVRLTLHDAQGRLVRELAIGEHAAGEHAVAFDGRDSAGRPLAPGLYLARLIAPGLDTSRRLVRVE